MDLTAIITSVLSLIAGMGVFLIACSMMSANLEALGSSRLKALFAKAAGSRLLGVGVGAAATAVIQSSSATSVMAIGFVNAGIMTLPQAAAVIFGANVGTTITGQLIALGLLGGGVPLSVIFAASAGVGAVLLTFAGTDRLQRTGGILAGFGMLFAGLDAMSTAMGTFAELEAVRLFLARFQSPLLLVAVGTVLTAVIQSSSAMTSMAIAMVATGLIALDQGIYITMGANIGTCVTALLAGAAGTENARRTALIHLIFNVGGAAVFLLASLPLGLAGWSYGALLGRLLPRTPQVQLAMFHTVFNVTTVLLVLPLTDRLTALVCRLVPGQEAQETGPRLLFVNAHMLKTPPIAVQQVKNEILHMGDVAMENFRLSCSRICSLEDEDKDRFRRNEEQLNYLNRELTGFIVQLLKADLSQQDRVYLSTAFRSVADFERIGDYAENIMEYADKLQAAGGRFSQRAVGEIGDLRREVEALYEQGMTAYREGDRKALRAAFQIEDGIDRITEQMGENHIQRLSEGVCTPSVGAQYLSLSANVERIADHIINVAKTINA